MSGTRLVKLCLYLHQNNETAVDIFQGRDWGEFLVVKVEVPGMTPELYEQIATTLRASLAQEGITKQVILIPGDWDLEFYGVEVDGE